MLTEEKHDLEQSAELRQAADADMVRVSPGEYAWAPREGKRPPAFGLHRWARAPDGRWRPAPVLSRYVLLTRDLIRFLGFRGPDGAAVGYNTLNRLAAAGEIDIIDISPRRRMLDVDSWCRYLAECIEDPDKWDEDSESTRNYLFRNGLTAERRR